MNSTSTPPVLGFVAYSGTGKTTLLTRVIPRLREAGVRVALIKHAHHQFDIDTPGKDSHRLREAGAEHVMIASRGRWVWMAETPGQDEACLAEMLQRLQGVDVDLILIEGFKHEHYPKIELRREELHNPRLYPSDPDIIAVACDGPLDPPTPLPVLDLNDPAAIARFVLEKFLGRSAQGPAPEAVA
ncbi:MAG TPA: molybdopterin-guanine dinucleotide biosynthesis protein B [Gammaproteobacteria bacterium]